MQDRIEKLRQQRALIDKKLARILAEEKKAEKREDDRVKVLVGAMFLDQIKRSGQGAEQLLAHLDRFLVRPREREAVLGEDGQGSTAFRRLTQQ